MILQSRKSQISNQILLLKNTSQKAKTPVAVRIYDETNELVYSESFLNMDKVEKVFDISERSYENYTFIVAYDTDKFIEKTLSAK